MAVSMLGSTERAGPGPCTTLVESGYREVLSVNNVRWRSVAMVAGMVVLVAFGVAAADAVEPVPVIGTEGLLIDDMTFDPTGILWLVGRDGVWRCDPSSQQMEQFPIRGEAPFVRCVAADADGAVWFGTDEAGAYRWNGKGFTHYGADDGLSGDCVFDLAVSPDGSVWFATNGGVSRLHDTEWTYWGLEEGLPSRGAATIAVDDDGRAWAGTPAFGPYVGGVVCIEGSHIARYGTEDGLPGDDVTCLTVAPDGAVWVGTYYGLAVFDGERWSANSEEGISGASVMSVTHDRQGSVWVANRSGVWKHDPEESPGALGSAGTGFPESIRALAVAADGTLWMAAAPDTVDAPTLYLMPEDN